MALNDPDIELDLVKANLVLPATNITGLAGVATAGTLVSLSDLDAGDRAFTNYLAAGTHAIVHNIGSAAITFSADGGHPQGGRRPAVDHAMSSASPRSCLIGAPAW